MEPNSPLDTSPSRTWVVGSDGSAGAEYALRWALAQAVGRARSLHVVRAWQLPTMGAEQFGVGPFADMEPTEAHPGLGALAADAAGADLEVTSEVTYGGASHMLLESGEGAALLVVGSRGLGGFRRLLLGSVSHQCATHAHGPVVVVRRPADDVTSGPVVSRLVVGVDGSPAACEALRWAHTFAGGEIPVLAMGTWTSSAFGGDEVHSELERLFQHAQSSFEATVDTVEAELGAGGYFERKFVSGAPAVALIEECELTGLLVVGERGHRFQTFGLLGSVAMEVLHRAQCPVAVIPAAQPNHD